MKYQLVIQFPEDMYDDLDEIAELEEELDEILIDSEVDGHDIGSGEVNIFIHTDKASDTLEAVKEFLEEKDIDIDLIKAGYRELGANDYIPLWPESLEEFYVA